MMKEKTLAMQLKNPEQLALLVVKYYGFALHLSEYIN
jgi:hypothetical protein